MATMTATASEMVERVQRIARKRAAAGTLAEAPQIPPAPPHPPAGSAAGPAPDGDDRGVGELALTLAEVLQDPGSLTFYVKLSRAIREGRLLPRKDRGYVRRLVLAKARELDRRRVPRGPIAKPGAVFNAWLRSLECDEAVAIEPESG